MTSRTDSTQNSAKPIIVSADESEALPKLFMRRLRESESAHTVKELALLFSENAELENLTRPTQHKMSGNANVQRHSPEMFWRQYLSAFETIESHFTNVTDDGRTAVLEWHSTGKLAAGHAIEYSGVSILEYTDGKIDKFRTYYDSAALLPHAARSGHHLSESVGRPEINIEAGS
jgi:ketosteroid isomerase-like protein